MPVDRPPRTQSAHITPQIVQAILSWIDREVDDGVLLVAKLYLQKDVHANYRAALIELEDRYDLADGELVAEYEHRLIAHAQALPMPRSVVATFERAQTLIEDVRVSDRAKCFLQSLPEPELLTALALGAPSLADQRGRRPDLFGYLEKVFRRCGLPYAASVQDGICWVGERNVRERGIEPALSALSDPLLADARKEFDKARGHLRCGELKDAGEAAGDAVETTMAVLLGAHGYPQSQTKHGTDLVQAKRLWDQLTSTAVGVLDENRDIELIYAPMKVRNACGHGVGANPKPPDPHYVEAGVAAAAVAITYLASKLP